MSALSKDYFKGTALTKLKALLGQEAVALQRLIEEAKQICARVEQSRSLLDRIAATVTYRELPPLEVIITPCTECALAEPYACDDYAALIATKTPEAVVALLETHPELLAVDCRSDTDAEGQPQLKIKLNEPRPSCFKQGDKAKRIEHRCLEVSSDYAARHQFETEAVIMPRIDETTWSAGYLERLAAQKRRKEKATWKPPKKESQ
jgi:hypothetical protein